MDCTCHSHNGFQLRSSEEELAQQLSLEGLTARDDCVIVDIQGSVSGLRRDEDNHVFDEGVIDEQYRRFLEVGV